MHRQFALGAQHLGDDAMAAQPGSVGYRAQVIAGVCVAAGHEQPIRRRIGVGQRLDREDQQAAVAKRARRRLRDRVERAEVAERAGRELEVFRLRSSRRRGWTKRTRGATIGRVRFIA